jgi:hypothetical protein
MCSEIRIICVPESFESFFFVGCRKFDLQNLFLARLNALVVTQRLNTTAIAERKVLFVVLLISPSAPFTPFIVFLKHHQIISAITVFANRAHPSRQSTEVVQSLGPPIDFLK